MTKRNDFIWKAIQTVCWIIFIALLLQTGTLLVNFFIAIFNPAATRNLHLGLDLSALYYKSGFLYDIVFVAIIIISGLKAYVFYLVIKIFSALNLVKPFSGEVSELISKITLFSFIIGAGSLIAQKAVEKLLEAGYELVSVERYWDDAGAYLMMSAVLFVISLIFRKGIELQNENELTV